MITLDPNQLIMTTNQLAQELGTTVESILKNFQRHPDDFQEGIQYFLLEGENFKIFQSLATNDLDSQSTSLNDLDSQSTSNFDDFSQKPSKRGGARKRYLWTLRGAFAHTWILKSSGAKAAYEKLVEQTQKPHGAQRLPAEALSKIEERMTAIESRCTAFLGIANTFADQNTELKDKLIAPTLDFMERDSIEFIIGDLNELVQLKKFSKENEATIIRYLKRIEALLVRTEEVDNRITKENIAHAGLHEEVKAITTDLTDLKTLANQIAQLVQPIEVKQLPAPEPAMI